VRVGDFALGASLTASQALSGAGGSAWGVQACTLVEAPGESYGEASSSRADYPICSIDIEGEEPRVHIGNMLSQKAKYALRALLALAAHGDDEPVHIADIAESENISRKFLESTLLELRKHGLLISRRGPGGGYRLARAPSEITFGEVIRIIDGPLAPVPCASVTAFHLCSDCPDPARCSVRWLMQQVRDATAGVLDNCTLADALGKRPAVRRRSPSKQHAKSRSAKPGVTPAATTAAIARAS
jgi:Rrf2 family protein